MARCSCCLLTRKLQPRRDTAAHPLIMARTVVPNIFGTRDRFCGRKFFHGPGCGGDGFIACHQMQLNCYSPLTDRVFFFFKVLFYFFRQRGREGEKHQCVAASHVPPTGDLASNPGMCPDWESNPLVCRPALNPLSIPPRTR